MIVEGSRAIRIDAALELAAVAESVTVSGAAPVVDVKTTALVNDFGVEELQEVPSATDVWAVLGQTAGVRMRGFDVGGSHKSQQTEYESFGIRGQHRVLADGVDTTEGTGGTGFYFTFARWKPQATLTLNHYVPDVAGSHDFKLGYDFQVDSSQVGSNANSGHIRYLDDSANDRPFNVDRIMLYSMPARGAIGSDDRNRHHAVFLQDTWRPTDQLSMILGVRYEQQRTYFLDATSTPFFDGVFRRGPPRAGPTWSGTRSRRASA